MLLICYSRYIWRRFVKYTKGAAAKKKVIGNGHTGSIADTEELEQEFDLTGLANNIVHAVKHEIDAIIPEDFSPRDGQPIASSNVRICPRPKIRKYRKWRFTVEYFILALLTNLYTGHKTKMPTRKDTSKTPPQDEEIPSFLSSDQPALFPLTFDPDGMTWDSLLPFSDLVPGCEMQPENGRSYIYPDTAILDTLGPIHEPFQDFSNSCDISLLCPGAQHDSLNAGQPGEMPQMSVA